MDTQLQPAPSSSVLPQRQPDENKIKENFERLVKKYGRMLDGWSTLNPDKQAEIAFGIALEAGLERKDLGRVSMVPNTTRFPDQRGVLAYYLTYYRPDHTRLAEVVLSPSRDQAYVVYTARDFPSDPNWEKFKVDNVRAASVAGKYSSSIRAVGVSDGIDKILAVTNTSSKDIWLNGYNDLKQRELLGDMTERRQSLAAALAKDFGFARKGTFFVGEVQGTYPMHRAAYDHLFDSGKKVSLTLFERSPDGNTTTRMARIEMTNAISLSPENFGRLEPNFVVTRSITPRR